MRIEAHGKYMQSILERACQTLAAESMVSGPAAGYKAPAGASIQEMGSPINFPALQDLHLYSTSGDDHLDHIQQPVDRSLEGFNINFPSNESGHVLGKTKPRHGPYMSSNCNGKSPMLWPADDQLRLEDAHCIGPAQDQEPCRSDHAMAHAFESKPKLPMAAGAGESKCQGLLKLDHRPASPRRAQLPVEMINPMMAARNVSYG